MFLISWSLNNDDDFIQNELLQYPEMHGSPGVTVI